MSVKLYKRKNADGTTSLLLDFYHNGKRVREFLKHLKLQKPTSLEIREQNKEFQKLAKQIAVERASQLQAGLFGLQTDAGPNTIITEWMQAYCDKYKKADKRNIQGAINKFKSFLADDKLTKLTFRELLETHVIDFRDYLNHNQTGEGGASYFKRFKKMLKAAFREKLLKEDIFSDVKAENKGARKKDTLTATEIQQLAQTPTESDQVKRAFLLSLMTGLRFCDVNSITWGNIIADADGAPALEFTQLKTGKTNTVPLNETSLALIGERGKPNQKVFNLPTSNGANKTLKAWVRRAGIQKAITWHNGRHTFGTQLIANDINVVTASRLLGHASLAHTQRYVDAAKELKQQAVKTLNINLT